EGKYLLQDNEVKIPKGGITDIDLLPYIKQSPNKKVLGRYRWYLGLYNLSTPGSNKFFSRTLRKIGEAPVIYDYTLTQQSSKQMQLFLFNEGYFNAVVKDTATLDEKQNAKISYYVNPGKQYRTSEITYFFKDTLIKKIIYADTINCLIKKGEVFTTLKLENERARIERYVRNQGYFGFSKEYISYEADTSGGNNSVKLKIEIGNVIERNEAGEINEHNHIQYRLKDIQVWVENSRSIDSADYQLDKNMFDVTSIGDVEFIYREDKTVKPKLISNALYLIEGKLFIQDDLDATYQALMALRVFKFVNISFYEAARDTTDSIVPINCRIQLTTNAAQSIQTEGELTNRTGFGVAGSINYQHRNVFKGAETFDFKIKGASEAVKSTNDIDLKYLLDLSASASLKLPKIIIPFNLANFQRENNPVTNISLSYAYLKQLNYSNRVANINYNYQWKNKRNGAFTVYPADINFIKILEIDTAFKAGIDTTYLRYSFMNHLVAATGINYVFSNQKPKVNANFWYLRTNLESSGNSAYFFMNMLKEPRNKENSYEIMGIPFAQYLKFDIDIRRYFPTFRNDKVVLRLYSGIAYPYGNSKSIPFERLYFAGGSNSMRAWSVRSLGPGSYKDVKQASFPDKASELKIESNLEYRFKMFWKLEGTLFVDAGNIWSISKNEEREDAKFDLKTFIPQLAVGGGWGARIDFSFFILRIDIAAKLRDPSMPEGKRWIPKYEKTFSQIMNIVFGIGYPF
ncbi:MAG TPA: BamA/TamA family outer membrane protein, partial [Bacteroidales bacterium]|nr:BamA/TamA family outer membrane protein [Bacteroidales bacterium]